MPRTTARRRAETAYRVAMYIVISKPQRMTSKDGLDHCIAISSICIPHFGRPTTNTRRFEAILLSEPLRQGRL
jgi:hypothetical protein